MNILLLGNGFDLYYKLPTKYINFINTVQYLIDNPSAQITTVGDVFGNEKLTSKDKGILESYERYHNAYDDTVLDESIVNKLRQLSNNMWFCYLRNSFNQDIGWIDFEKEIAEVLSSFQNMFANESASFVFSKIVESDAKRYIIKQFGVFLKLFRESSGALLTGYTYISDEYSLEYPLGSKNRIINKGKIISKMKDSLDELAEGLQIYLKSFVEEMVEKAKSNEEEYGKFTNCLALCFADSVITFNYTDTYEKIYEETTIHHIHGNVKEKIVLGINPDLNDEAETVNTDFITFKKYFQRTMLNVDNEYIKSIREYQEIQEDIQLVVMGHSLDITDQDIIKEIFDISSEINILYHSDWAKRDYISNIVRIFGKAEFDVLRSKKKLSFIHVNSDLSEFATNRRKNSSTEYYKNMMDFL